MTGPSSWRNLHDVHSSERSEAWSELLGLRSNPRTSQGSSHGGGLFSSPQFTPSQPPRTLLPELFAEAQETLTPRSRTNQEPGSSFWMPSPAEVRGRKSLDSAFASIPCSTSDKQPLTRPKKGLRALDPLFDAMEASASQPSVQCSVQGLKSLDPLFTTLGSSASASSQSLEPLFEYADGGSQAPLLKNLTTMRSLPREHGQKILGALSPSASQPLLCKDSHSKRALSPVSSHSALATEVMGRASETLSPVTSEAVIQHEGYRREALDFVTELAGPQVTPRAAKKDSSEAQVIKADELPIPAFAIDRDANVTMWNKQLVGFTGWEEEEMLKGLTSLSAIFQADSRSGTRNKGCLELMRGVLFGMSPPESLRFLLRRRPGTGKGGYTAQDGAGKPPRQLRSRSKSMGEAPLSVPTSSVPVELRFSRRTDSMGGVTGVVCVVVPVSEAVPQTCENCRVGATRNVAVSVSRSGEGEVLPERTPEMKQPVLLADGAIFEPCPSSTSSSSSGGGDPVGPSAATTLSISDSPIKHSGLFPASSSSPSPATTDSASDALQVKALVMESVDAVRMELAQNLERCGVEVASCSTLGEAMWCFEKSLSDPADGPGFDVIFLELEPHTDELFLAIRDLRRLEEEARIMGQVPAPALEAVLQSGESGGVPAPRPEIKDETSLLASSISEVDADCSDIRSMPEAGARVDCNATVEGERLGENEPDSVADAPQEHGSMFVPAAGQEVEKRCMILALVNLNRWDLAGLDVAMDQCVRAGGDAVIPRSMSFQQLKTALRKLGIRSKYLMFPSRLPRALSGNLHNPLNLSR